MAGFRVELKGMDQVLAFLRKLPDTARASYRKRQRGEGEQIMGKAKKLTPVKYGALRDSGIVEGPEPEGNSGDVEVMRLAFGGPSAPYADVQHERLDFHHTTGQAKFLEQPALEAIPGMPERIAAGMRQDLEGSGA